MSLIGILDRVADAAALDKLIDPARRAVQGVLRPQAVKDLLHGTWLGHPLHPVLVHVPVGCWLSAGLLDLVPPFPWSEARTILTEELGREPQEVFTYLNQRPLAAGSLAQVHLGRLRDDSTVAVKILRPNIERTIERDLKRARRFARLLERTGAGFIV